MEFGDNNLILHNNTYKTILYIFIHFFPARLFPCRKNYGFEGVYSKRTGFYTRLDP